jgi:hypothetical protein
VRDLNAGVIASVVGNTAAAGAVGAIAVVTDLGVRGWGWRRSLRQGAVD